jgi:dihydroflavonol-4-reductase
VVIVNPTAPVGDHDFKPTPTGKIIVDFLRGAMPAYIDTGLNLVDVRDVAEGAAGVATTAWSRVTGKEPLAPLDAVRMAKKKMFVSHAKAAGELGYQPGPVDGALERAVEWFRGNGYC